MDTVTSGLYHSISHAIMITGFVAMMAISGDESFVMLSMMPEQAPLIFGLLLLTGLTAGFLTDALFAGIKDMCVSCSHEFDIHEEDICHCFPWGQLRRQWRHCTLPRSILSLFLLIFLLAIVSRKPGPPIWNWIRITLAFVSCMVLFVIATVPDYFLEDYLWKHVVKVHVPRVFLWTFSALLLMNFLLGQFHFENWLQDNQLIVLLFACLVGLIPESGPHLIFLTLYVEGTIPLSIFLASSVVQDGYGMLPMLAESRKEFLRIKGINLVVGLLVGFIGYFSGW